MKRVQNATSQEKALNELYKRYDKRGMTYDRSPEYTEQKSREISTRTTAPKSYKISASGVDNLKKFKNGVAGKRRYMTDGDFARYYKASREYTPEANVELDTTILLQKIDRARYKKEKAPMKTDKNDIKKKLKAEADRSNPKRPVKNQVRRENAPAASKPTTKQSTIKQVAREAAKTWIPIEERNDERIVEGTKTKLPTKVILAIAVITISLLMIVASAVLVSTALYEQNELKDGIEDLEFQISELETDLNKKNEKIDIEYFAKEELGMINQEHVNAEYINSNKTDGVVKHETDKASITSLIDWIFQFLK